MSDLQPAAGRNRRWAHRLVQACHTTGCHQFFLAPGSRCSPLTLAVAEHPQSRVLRHFDERGLAFACLGYGRSTGRAGVFICTSGTAVANAWPAVVEAWMDGIPMLLLTADRPPELRGSGANQTIDQQQIFGQYAHFFFDLPCPDACLPEDLAESVIQEAVRASARGPVHINCMFREPLADGPPPAIRPEGTANSSVPAPFEPVETHITGKTSLVIAGGCSRQEAQAARALARRLACPFLADVTSGLRGLPFDLSLMRTDLPAAESVIHVGNRVTSKRWWQWLDQHPPREFLQMRRYPPPIDPIRRVTQFLTGSPAALCEALVAEHPCDPTFFDTWQRCCEEARTAARQILRPAAGLHEPGIAQRLAGWLPADHGLFLGNSMPIRDMDTFGTWPEDRWVAVGANRGASGIDGLVGSACGFAIGSERPVTVLLGDLSFLHDLNSLAMVFRGEPPLVIIVVNNNGGGIFHFLPIASVTDKFEDFFATPHGLSFSHAADLFRLAYARPNSWSDFESAYRAACQSGHSALIEIGTDRCENLTLHRRVEQAVRNLDR